MLKKIGLLAVAGIAALALGTAVFGGTQSANAETTDVVNVNCSLIGAIVPDACYDHIDTGEIQDLADELGNEDGTLEPEDFDDFEFYDASQLSEQCTTDLTTPGLIPTTDAGTFMGCTMLIFTFVDDEGPVTLDLDSGLTSLQNPPATDFTCDTDSDDGGDTIGNDNDCDDVFDASNGDGVVVFHVINESAERGDERTVRVSQEAVEQATELTLVGIADDIEIVLAEDVIGTNGSVANAEDCADDTDVASDAAISNPESTVAVVTVEDEDNTLIAMWPISIGVEPPGDDPDIIVLGGDGNATEGIDPTTILTIDTGDDSLPIGYYTVVCGGSGTGTTEIEAVSLTDGSAASAEITVVGFAANTALVAAPAEIKCDGSETSTVSATITDSDGNNVADGTRVQFTVVALGTANPIIATTTDGVATSVITPLSNSSAGVTVLVSPENGSDASFVSIRVDCALPLVTQPTLAPPPTVPPTGPISPPDTGNGGYLAQDGGSSLWTLIALAIGGTIVVAGGLVARRSSN